MDRESEIRWLRGELRKHEQPCECVACRTATAELMFWGGDLAPVEAAPEVAEPAR